MQIKVRAPIKRGEAHNIKRILRVEPGECYINPASKTLDLVHRGARRAFWGINPCPIPANSVEYSLRPCD